MDIRNCLAGFRKRIPTYIYYFPEKTINFCNYCGKHNTKQKCRKCVWSCKLCRWGLNHYSLDKCEFCNRKEDE